MKEILALGSEQLIMNVGHIWFINFKSILVYDNSKMQSAMEGDAGIHTNGVPTTTQHAILAYYIGYLSTSGCKSNCNLRVTTIV